MGVPFKGRITSNTLSPSAIYRLIYCHWGLTASGSVISNRQFARQRRLSTRTHEDLAAKVRDAPPPSHEADQIAQTQRARIGCLRARVTQKGRSRAERAL